MTMQNNVLTMTPTKKPRGNLNLVFMKVRSRANGYWKYVLTGADPGAIARAVGHVVQRNPPGGDATIIVLTRLTEELAHRTLDLMRPTAEADFDRHIANCFTAKRGTRSNDARRLF